MFDAYKRFFRFSGAEKGTWYKGMAFELLRSIFEALQFAALLIGAAAVASLLIKETLDSTDPENTMPLIEASVGYTKLNVIRADFEWNYITRTVRGPALSDEAGDVPLAPLDVPRRPDPARRLQGAVLHHRRAGRGP